MSRLIAPKDWPQPKGYSQGAMGRGRVLAIAGQVGRHPPGARLATGMAAQFAAALDNVLTVLESAGGRPGDVVSMTIFVTSKPAYLTARKSIGTAWRQRFGRHYPAMTLVVVKDLLEPKAVVEIQALAVLP